MTRLIFASDLHFSYWGWYGYSSPDRMELFVSDMHAHYKKRPFESVLFLGDVSRDHGIWEICGSWLDHKTSFTDRFIKEYAARLPASWHLIPGNHEQYGSETWRKITGRERQYSVVIGGYLIIFCDNFAKDLDPDFHTDGVYTVTDLDFVRAELAKTPDLPVLLCSHFFDARLETEEFFKLLREEKRITALFCGHDHLNYIEELGEKGGNLLLYHDGSFSHSSGGAEALWGYCEVELRGDGIEAVYISPEREVKVDFQPYHHPYAEHNRIFIPRRDL